MATEDWERAAAFVRARRTALDMTQHDVQTAGGPSAAKVREIENQRSKTLSASKRRDLERAIKWAPNSFDTVLAGGDPELLTYRNEGRGLDDLLATATTDSAPRPAEVIAEATSASPPRSYFDALRELVSAIESAIDAFQTEAHTSNIADDAINRVTNRLSSIQSSAIDLLVEQMRREIDRLKATRSESPAPHQGESDDMDSATKPGAQAQAGSPEKTRADVSSDYLDTSDTTGEYDLAARDTGRISEAELRRREQDRASE